MTDPTEGGHGADGELQKKTQHGEDFGGLKEVSVWRKPCIDTYWAW